VKLLLNINDLENRNNENIELKVFLDNIIENSPSGIVAIREDGTILRSNRAAAIITGLESLLQKDESIFEISDLFTRFKSVVLDVIKENSILKFSRERVVIGDYEKYCLEDRKKMYEEYK